MTAASTASAVFVSTAAKMKSSLSSLGYSFLLLHQSEGRGRRWTATGETRTKFRSDGGIRFAGVELSGNANGKGDDDESQDDNDSAQREREIADVVRKLIDAVEDGRENVDSVDADNDSLGSQLPPLDASPSVIPGLSDGRLTFEERRLMKNSQSRFESSKIPRGLISLTRLVEDVCRRDGGDAFLLVEGAGDDKQFWFGTGKLRLMALKGELQSEAAEGNRENEETVVEERENNRDGAAAANGETKSDPVGLSGNSALSGNDKAVAGLKCVEVDLSDSNDNPTYEDGSSSGAESDDSEIEIIGTVAAPPSPPRRSPSPSSSSASYSSSHSPSNHCQYITSFSTKNRPPPKEAGEEGDEDDANSETDRSVAEEKDTAKDGASGGHKRKSVTSVSVEGEPAEKKRMVTDDNGPKVFRVDEQFPGPVIHRFSEGSRSEEKEKEKADETKDDSQDAEGKNDKNEQKTTDNGGGDDNDDHDDDHNHDDNHDDNHDAVSSDGSDIEVIGTVSPPRRSRSSSRSSSHSRSRSYSRSRSRSPRRSPRGSRSPSPLFTRDFLYSGAPRITLPPCPFDEKDSDVEDVTEEATAEQRLYDEEVFQGEGSENKKGGSRPPPGKKGDIECIEVDDEDC